MKSSHFLLLAGGNEPVWALRGGLSYNYQTRIGSPALGFPPGTDTHSSDIYVQTASGLYVPKGANVPCQSDLGHQTVPTAAQLFGTDPTDATTGISAQAGVTITSNAVADPFGGMNGDSIAIAAGANYIYWQVSGSVTAQDRCGWLILRADGPVTARLRMSGGFVTTINIDTQWRAFPIAGSVTAASVELGIDNRSAFGGDELAKTIYIAHRQLEARLFRTSPIRTASASVTGNLARISGLGTLLANGVGGIVQVDARGVVFNSSRAIQISDPNDATTFIAIYPASSTGYWKIRVIIANVLQADIETTAVAGGVATIAFAASPNYFKIRVVGDADTSADTSGSYPALADIGLGGTGLGTGQNMFGFTRKLSLVGGAQDAATFANIYAKAQLAAAA